MLAVQPFMLSADYAWPALFQAKIHHYVAEAAQRGWLNPRTILVFPEHIGTWLAAAGGDMVARAATLAAALRPLIIRHGWSFLRAFVHSSEADRAVAALFRARAATMAALYSETFATLAAAYGVTIVAGSIVLPAPQVEAGRVSAGRGPLYNTAVVFAANGEAYPHLVRKIYPIRSEQGFVAAADVAALPVFATPAGRLGVLICADAWYPAPYAHLAAQGVELLAVPSYVAEKGVWRQPWAGYNGGPAPADVDLGHVGVLSEGEAWRRYALAGRIEATAARAGIHVFLRGRLWDLGGDSGESMAVAGRTVVETESEAAALLNLWL